MMSYPGSKYKASLKDEPTNGEVELLKMNSEPSNDQNMNCDPEKVPFETKQNGKTLMVNYVDRTTCRRRRTSLEKYLIVLCLIFLCAFVTFLVLALTKDASLHQGLSSQLIQSAANTKSKTQPCLTKYCVQTAAFMSNKMDTNVDPCDDFFNYACGTWNRKHVIPEDKSSYNTIVELHDSLQITLKALLEEPRLELDSRATLLAKTLYKSCVNTSLIEDAGDAPLRSLLKELGGWPLTLNQWDESQFSLEKLLGKLRGTYNAPVLIDQWVSPDDKNSSRYIIQLDQAGLGMPSREYFLSSKHERQKAAYVKLLKAVSRLLGASRDVDKQIEDILHFETKVANMTVPLHMRQDTGEMYNKMSLIKLSQKMPKFDWLLYINSMMPYPLTEEEEVVVYAPSYLSDLVALINITPRRTVANYVMWRTAMGLIPEMTEKYRSEIREYSKVLQGVTKEKVRWKKCVEYCNEQMGTAVGAMFVRENFQKDSKEDALEMIHNIREAFNKMLMDNTWMDEDTKRVAKEKADAINERIGYPDYITDKDALDAKFKGLSFREDSFFNSTLQLAQFKIRYNLMKLNETVSDKWEQAPAVVNAFYNPSTNDIMFPAGILQPMFYSKNYPKSLNYGGIGVVIGHEITHGFDDKGRQYDKNGNLQQWWKNETIRAFRERAKCMIDQYNEYKLDQIGMNINGKITQGENIADNGGLKEAFLAYRMWVDRNGEEQLLPGINLTHNQLFFLNYAQIMCGKMRNEQALIKIRTAVHSPGQIRVLGPLSNSVEFSESFNCPLGSRMNPRKKCLVW
ncbi:unnamed protein product [Owenia fusiformis]|uniref:Uncharacterized protein n=1 Tax=Owenia fusiformis TaxID=6347 RepID=A0A8S4N254_OWEFU|nr:unnamed protein product [Owenia fusiformis]